MFAAGSITTREVATAFGVSEETVRNVLRQDWFQETVTKLMAEQGGRDIMALFRGETINSLVTLVELRDGKDTPKAVKRACCTDILDRALGKPLQRVEQSGSPKSDDPVREAQQLEEANTRLRSQLQTGVLRNPGEIPEQQPEPDA